MIPKEWVPPVQFEPSPPPVRVICKVDGCEKGVQARGWCSTHYSRWKRRGNALAPPRPPRGQCTLEDCDLLHYAHGWCRRHYDTWRVHGDPCANGGLEDMLPNPWVDVAPSCPEGHPPPDVFLWHPAPEDGGRWYCRVCIRRFDG